MNTQSQLRSSSTEVPRRWIPAEMSDDEIRAEEENRRYCTMCRQDKPDLVLLRCGHSYCKACLDHYVRLFLNLKDFPPRCCGQKLSVYKYSNVLSADALSRYLGIRTKKAHQGNIYCAGAACERFLIRHYLVEDGWGLCAKCYQVTCGRYHRLRIHHKGDWEARICPTTIDLTTTDAASSEAAKEAEPHKCSKCHETVPHIGGRNAMPCPCGAIICRKCAEVHRRIHGILPFGCWCRVTAQPRSAVSETRPGVPDPATSTHKTTLGLAPTKAQPNLNVLGQVCTGVSIGAALDSIGENSIHEIKLPPILPPQQQQQLSQRHLVLQQGLVNSHSWFRRPTTDQCNQCHCLEQVLHCTRCMVKSCKMCSTRSCRELAAVSKFEMPQKNADFDKRALGTSVGLPTLDGVRHALNGKENGLTRNQISQVLCCPAEFLNRILGQMLNTNLIWVSNTADETRYGLRQSPASNSNDVSASDVVYYGMLHTKSDSQPLSHVPQHPSDQSGAGVYIQNSDPQGITAMDVLAKVCHDRLTQIESIPARAISHGCAASTEIEQIAVRNERCWLS